VGEYGDFTEQLDASVGMILKTLDSMKLSENTIVIFTSDNGPYWREDYINKYQHQSAGPWRGMKGDAYEGGHRVPFIVRWPGKIKPGTISHATTSHANLLLNWSTTKILITRWKTATALWVYGKEHLQP
jgi:arylsulfatase A-like enzyme